jgi:hypothetical protein
MLESVVVYDEMTEKLLTDTFLSKLVESRSRRDRSF